MYVLREASPKAVLLPLVYVSSLGFYPRFSVSALPCDSSVIATLVHSSR